MTISTRPSAGDVYLFRREDGRLGSCRVIRAARPNEQARLGAPAVLVAGSAWVGDAEPDLTEPALREVAVWTHGAWKNREDIAFVVSRLPRSFRKIGTITPSAEEARAPREAQQTGWHGFGPWAPPRDTSGLVEGTMHLARYNGEEKYAIERAEVMVTCHDAPGHVRVFVEVFPLFPALRRDLVYEDDDGDAEGTNLGAEVSFDLAEIDDPRALVGRTFDARTAGFDATFSYHETEALDDARLEILRWTADRLSLALTGTTVDVNYYDGSRPPTRVTIRTTALFVDRS